MKWKCRNGRELALHEIETTHLKNIIAMLRRNHVVTHDEFLSAAAYAYSSSSGEYAAMAVENEIMAMKPWKGLDVLEEELSKRHDL